MTIESFINKFSKLHPKSIDLSLTRIRKLLKKMGDPQNKLPSIIHVAGTNGKGSTISFIRSILECAGIKVQAYTSPHLIKFNERIRLANGIISDEFLIEIFEECNYYNGNDPITFFEITTVAAFLAFSRNEADILLLEVGLGGRYDTTNVVKNPILTSITPISIDHVDFLGESIEEIAYQKGGIIKKNVPLVIGPQDKRSLKVLKKIAYEANSPTTEFSRDWKYKILDNHYFEIQYLEEKMKLPKPGLLGKHQISNASQAIACCLTQNKFKISESNISKGLQQVYWPGRLQKVYIELLELNHPKIEIILDGSHNAEAGKNLSEFIDELKKYNNKKTILVLGMLKNKNSIEYLKFFKKIIDLCICIPISSNSLSYEPKKLKNISEKHIGIPSITASNFNDALHKIANISNFSNTNIIASGSLYLIGQILRDSNYIIK